ncbi:anthrone oxygenase family protein [Streptomyces sp. DSM 41527]|uniref:Anthrone oxygenase family protein n=1 Tax=Streptomyces mooreae TaxID=3075523 RepID=A0ABU2TAQ4_9ACTN|nr:anthrone oxygenase family protein [Streptomyces sp. DSM 41527]MDT0458030.1 anthrone oxygenase family protein [Streptomyces sp. DSM 41527]
MRALQTVTLLVATLGAGLMAGLFAAFAYAVMPGLGRSTDPTFVQAMQNINRAIINGWFLLPFLLPVPLLVLATVLAWSGPGQVALPWILAALVLYLAGFFVTGGVNVPLNNALDNTLDQALDNAESEGSPGAPADRTGALKAARESFEGRWVTWNVVRALAHTAAFGMLVWALFLHGTAGTG